MRIPIKIARHLPVLGVQFSNALAASILIPILPLFAVTQLGASPFQAIALEAAYYGAKLISTPLLGSLSDRLGRKPIFLIGQLGTVASFILFLCILPLTDLLEKVGISQMSTIPLLLLYFGRMLDGATGGNTTIARLYISDRTDKKDRAQVLGWLSASLGVGFVVGPAIGGMLAYRFSLYMPIICGLLLAFLALLTVLLGIESSSKKDGPDAVAPKPSWHASMRDFKRLWRAPLFAKLLTIGFFGPLCFNAISPTLVLYVKQTYFLNAETTMSVSQFVGWMYTLIGITLTVTQIGLIKPLGEKLGDYSLIRAALIGLIVTFSLIPIAENRFAFLGILMVSVVAYGILGPPLQAIIVQDGSEHEMGKRLGLFQSVSSLANIVGPLGAGFLFEAISPRSIWWAAVVLLLPAIHAALTLNRRKMVSQPS